MHRHDDASSCRQCSFDGFSEDPQQYGELTTLGFTSSCRDAAVKAMCALQQHRLQLTEATTATGASGSQARPLPSAGSGAAAGGAGLPETQPGPPRLGQTGSGSGGHGDSASGGLASSHRDGGGVSSPGREEQLATQAAQIRRDRPSQSRGPDPEYAAFLAEINAKVVADAEAYYRAMFSTRVSSWNARDTHMVETIVALQRFLTQRAAAQQAHQQITLDAAAGLVSGGTSRTAAPSQQAVRPRPARIVVWAHNSHIGDARATEVARRGEINVGQLLRQAYPPGATYLIGQSTYTGTVTAAHNWDGEYLDWQPP